MKVRRHPENLNATDRIQYRWTTDALGNTGSEAAQTEQPQHHHQRHRREHDATGGNNDARKTSRPAAPFNAAGAGRDGPMTPTSTAVADGAVIVTGRRTPESCHQRRGSFTYKRRNLGHPDRSLQGDRGSSTRTSPRSRSSHHQRRSRIRETTNRCGKHRSCAGRVRRSIKSSARSSQEDCSGPEVRLARSRLATRQRFAGKSRSSSSSTALTCATSAKRTTRRTGKYSSGRDGEKRGELIPGARLMRNSEKSKFEVRMIRRKKRLL